ncbi:FG-GAP-like repeat-containing protein [Streptomyces sp. NRRL S-87]|uniref:FG-GAP-like repeat-containing protein n=1 Tax=Streptomyces sp. NRRL S-87 TaxID=1463920 RepID=UPI0004C126A7|nr:FG-GAP-like repeat-containing protein [Streptomyces sp. NRRL S-87]
MRSSRYLSATAVAVAVLAAVTGPIPAQAAPSAAAAGVKPVVKKGADVNGDGYADLAVGAPNATVDGVRRAGLVSIVYGSAAGLRYDKQQLVSRATPGVPGDLPESSTGWGYRASYGDVDTDGFDDVILTPSGTASPLVLWGSAKGIAGGTRISQGDGANTIAAGDVNGDGKTDLVIAGRDGTGSESEHWGLRIQYGPIDRATGLPAASVFRNTQAADGVAVTGVQVDDMTGDGVADIVATGTSTKMSEGYRGFVLKGTRGGLVKGGTLDARYGVQLGDLNGDGYRDVVAAPDSMPAGDEHGAISVTYGGPDGVSKTLPARLIDQNTPGVPGTNEKRDLWGDDVALGDVDRDGYADIVVGAPGETVGTGPWGSGSITVLRGSRTGVTTTGAQVVTQGTAGVPSTSEASDHFGEAVTLVDGNADGRPEAYVGGSGEDGWVGRVWQLPTTATALTGTGSKAFNLGGGHGAARFGAFFAK